MIHGRCILSLLLVLCFVAGCSRTATKEVGVRESGMPSFVSTGNVNECDCIPQGLYFAQAALGLSPLNQLPTTKSTDELRERLQEAATKVGGKLTIGSLAETLQAMTKAEVGPQPLSVVVHQNGHIYGLLGTMDIDGTRLFQLIHGGSQVWLASKEQMGRAGFKEVWHLEREGNGVPFRVGEGELIVDKVYENFGEVRPYQDVPCTFNLKNQGKKNLILHKPASSCTCTTVDMPQIYTLRPGESFDVRLMTRTAKKPIGKQEVMLECFKEGTGKRLAFSLILLSTQRETFEIAPTTINLKAKKLCEELSEKIYLHEVASDRFTIKSIETDLNNFRYDIKLQEKDSNLKSYCIYFSCTPSPIELIKSDKTIRIHTTSPFAPLITVPVRICVEPDVQVKPTSLSFGTSVIGKSYSKEFSLEAEDTLSIVNITAPKMVACTFSDAEKSLHEINVTFSPQVAGIWEDVLIIHLLKGEEAREIHVNLVAFVR